MSRAATRSLTIVIAVLVLLAALATAAVVWLNQRGEDPLPASPTPSANSGPGLDATPEPPNPDKLERGRYLTVVGNCMTCHTVRGGEPYAGGRNVDTPFGTVFSPNLTPDPDTGLGKWSSAQFWRALHNGRSRDGRLLYPAFPYPNYTRVNREDSDAMYAYLQTLPPVVQPNRPDTLRFPYNSQAALAVWRALFFTPGASAEHDATKSAEWNRGAYLVQGLGHCNACHASRNAFGATAGNLDLSGGLIPVQNWYAPSLNALSQASVADWSIPEIMALLKVGVTAKGSVLGPMAEVVQGSTQYLNEGDLRSMAVYLKELPVTPEPAPDSPVRTGAQEESTLALGSKLHTEHCAQCHGDKGEGAPNAYPPLAGNRAVTMDSAANIIRIILAGGFPPATEGNPRPYGMQPFATVLNNDELAAVTSHIRTAWGNKGSVVTPLEVNRLRVGGER
ncbi:cytochrome c [soil metagenome]